MALDPDHLRAWIGRESVATDTVTADLVHRFDATFDAPGPAPEPGAIAPRFVHFCLAPAVEPMRALGRDGHPARGGFLPPVPLPRRMRAGGSVVFHGDLRVGDFVERRARITDVVVKEGLSGRLCFVTVENRFLVGGEARISETEDIVYRDDGAAGPGKTPPEAAPGTWSRAQPVTPTTLFRYSAITFNGHRIHYDRRYAIEVEGYPGLVVHGPIQATYLYRYAAELRGAPPDRFSFRARAPIFDDDAMRLCATETGTGGLRLWSARDGGPVATLAEADWTPTAEDPGERE
ncbi:MAG: protein dehydratase [Rhodovulum sulfidophilum]|uniref:Protein dehydratase n=1 Tax=Rhodovulum sulfidophilum TaxID=35806 RepID=A0A2W5NA82_RHOSU|nr:MAG: protein dehydratase [Rhodovulum sulfidophilum]